jgi:Ca2+-transporting ATPase
MKQPPRKLTDQVIDFSLLLRVLSSAVVILCGTLFVFLIEADDDIVSPRDTTMTFTCFVFFDMFNAFSCRSINKSVFSIGLLTNQTLVYSITGSVICQLLVVYFPPLQTIFQTEPIRLLDIVFLTLLSSSVLIVDEVFKKIKLVLSHRQLHSKLELNV